VEYSSQRFRDHFGGGPYRCDRCCSPREEADKGLRLRRASLAKVCYEQGHSEVHRDQGSSGQEWWSSEGRGRQDHQVRAF